MQLQNELVSLILGRVGHTIIYVDLLILTNDLYHLCIKGPENYWDGLICTAGVFNVDE
jgi:hypothetical protein